MEISQLIPIQGERKLFFERSRMFSVIVGFQDPIPESPGWDFTRGQAQLKRIEEPLRPAPVWRGCSRAAAFRNRLALPSVCDKRYAVIIC